MDDIVTADFSNFGYREIDEAIKLLTYYKEDKQTSAVTAYMGDGVKVAFNTHSGFVFLTDEDYNSFLINSELDLLDIWVSCPNCGGEGFPEEVIANKQCDECVEYAEQYRV